MNNFEIIDKLVLIYLKKQDISKLSPEDLYDLYFEIRAKMIAHNKDKSKK